MKAIDKRIAQKIKDWPGVYQKRADVLHKWFCVNSNGWEDGKIAPNPYPRDKQLKPQKRVIDFSKSNRENYLDIRHNLHCAKEALIVENAQILALIPLCIENSGWIFPMSNNCNLVTFGEDIDSEYADAAREVIEMVFSTNPDERYAEKEFRKNIKIAEMALEKLQQYEFTFI